MFGFFDNLKIFALVLFIPVTITACVDESSSTATPIQVRNCPNWLTRGGAVGTTPCPADGICFIAMGDTGNGSCDQLAVATGVAAKCESDGCDFGVLLGDIIYTEGAASKNDPQWITKFEHPYRILNFPFYGVLGNHDYHLSTTQGRHYVKYAETSSKFIMPAPYYGFERGDALFLALDSTPISSGWGTSEADQGVFFDGEIALSTKPWKIAMTHHPYLANGRNVNPFGNIKTFFENHLCGNIDLFLAGHEHSRQVLPGNIACPGTFVVSGAGAKTRVSNQVNPFLFQRDTLGFAYLQVTPAQIVIEMLDRFGHLEYSITLP